MMEKTKKQKVRWMWNDELRCKGGESKKVRGEGGKATTADMARSSWCASPSSQAFAGRTINVALVVSISC